MRAPVEYEIGRPSWVDLATNDLEAARLFYAALFGWEYDAVPGGGYFYATLEGHRAAGMAQGQNPELAPMWTTYLAVPSADEVSDRVRAAGGSVLVGPMTVGPAGRMAYCADPLGAHFGLWEGDEHGGAGAINEPGAFTWSELVTSDLDTAVAFYNAVFGLTTEPRDAQPDYHVFVAAEQVVGGVTLSAQDAPAGWHVYIGVADADATAAAAVENGGSVAGPPADIGVGRTARLTDPQGAHFGVVAFSQWLD